MKRLKPQERKAWAFTHVVNLEHKLLCMYGNYNSGKLLRALEKELRNKRLRNKRLKP